MNAPHKTPNQFTSREFTRLVRAGGFGDTRVELRQGMIVKMNPQHLPHAKVKRLLAKAIEQGLAAASVDWIVDQEVSVDLSENFQPLPDLVVWDSTGVPADLDGPIPKAAVRLIVEIADSSLADDLGSKLEEYAGAQVSEYWVADVKAKILIRHKGPSAAGYTERLTSRFGEALDSLAYPALRFDTKALA